MHDLLLMSPDINNIAIITVKGDDYRYITYDDRESDIHHFLESFVFNDCGLLNNLYKTRPKEISTKNKVHNIL